MIKYKKISEVIEAVDRGSKLRTVLDNDNVMVWDENSKCVYGSYDMTPGDLLRELLTLVGIPWNNA